MNSSPYTKRPGDQVVSSTTANRNLRDRCFRLLREVSPARGVLLKSYLLPEVTISDDIPFASGEFMDAWKGQQSGNQVCVKVFRTQQAARMDKFKQAWRFFIPTRGELNVDLKQLCKHGENFVATSGSAKVYPWWSVLF